MARKGWNDLIIGVACFYNAWLKGEKKTHLAVLKS